MSSKVLTASGQVIIAIPFAVCLCITDAVGRTTLVDV